MKNSSSSSNNNLNNDYWVNNGTFWGKIWKLLGHVLGLSYSQAWGSFFSKLVQNAPPLFIFYFLKTLSCFVFSLYEKSCTSLHIVEHALTFQNKYLKNIFQVHERMKHEKILLAAPCNCDKVYFKKWRILWSTLSNFY